jgi:hypothetical protein
VVLQKFTEMNTRGAKMAKERHWRGGDSATWSQWTRNEAVLCPGRDFRTSVLLVAANLAPARSAPGPRARDGGAADSGRDRGSHGDSG